jgi:hypothetical membrane protein
VSDGVLAAARFPETAPIAHEITSDIAFILSGISAPWAYRLTKAPMSYFSLVLGAVNLVAMALFTANVPLGLGVGGIERTIVYPVVIWVIGLGGYLLGSGAGQVPSPPYPAPQ